MVQEVILLMSKHNVSSLLNSLVLSLAGRSCAHAAEKQRNSHILSSEACVRFRFRFLISEVTFEATCDSLLVALRKSRYCLPLLKL